MKEYEALIVSIVTAMVAYPILYVLLKTIEYFFGAGCAIFTGSCCIIIGIVMIMEELKKNE